MNFFTRLARAINGYGFSADPYRYEIIEATQSTVESWNDVLYATSVKPRMDHSLGESKEMVRLLQKGRDYFWFKKAYLLGPNQKHRILVSDTVRYLVVRVPR